MPPSRLSANNRRPEPGRRPRSRRSGFPKSLRPEVDFHARVFELSSARAGTTRRTPDMGRTGRVPAPSPIGFQHAVWNGHSVQGMVFPGAASRPGKPGRFRRGRATPRSAKPPRSSNVAVMRGGDHRRWRMRETRKPCGSRSIAGCTKGHRRPCQCRRLKQSHRPSRFRNEVLRWSCRPRATHARLGVLRFSRGRRGFSAPRGKISALTGKSSR